MEADSVVSIVIKDRDAVKLLTKDDLKYIYKDIGAWKRTFNIGC